MGGDIGGDGDGDGGSGGGGGVCLDNQKTIHENRTLPPSGSLLSQGIPPYDLFLASFVICFLSPLPLIILPRHTPSSDSSTYIHRHEVPKAHRAIKLTTDKRYCCSTLLSVPSCCCIYIYNTYFE